MMRRRFVAMFIALAVAVLAIAAYAELSVGSKAPKFELPTIDGKTFTFADCLAKPTKVVVLDLWATWCPPCRAEVPVLVELSDKYKSKGVLFVGVAVDQSLSMVKEFAKKYKINYTVAHDPNGEAIGRLYKLRSLPSTYIIDSTGTIRYVHVGFGGKEGAKIESEIKSMIGEK